MKSFYACGISFALAFSATTALAAQETATKKAPYTLTQSQLKHMTPAQALERLQKGNKRFVANKPIKRNLLQQAKATKLHGQYPAAVVLSCMDSRGPAELIFDQGLGDIFSLRVAGNVINPDQLGSMEFAAQVVGSKLIVVMGHTRCGAIRGACNNVTLGNLTGLLDKIKPAVNTVQQHAKNKLNCDDNLTIDKIAKQNVMDMIEQITAKSPSIKELAKAKKVMIIGAMHDLRSGRVTFFNENGKGSSQTDA